MLTSKYHLPAVAPDPQNELQINGLSLLFYDFYLVSHDEVKTANCMTKLESSYHYKTIFDFVAEGAIDHEFYLYSRPLTITPLMLPTAGIVKGTARLLLQLIENHFLLAVTIINIDSSGRVIDGPKLESKEPFRTNDVLTLINELNESSGSLYGIISAQRNQAVSECFGAFEIPANASQSRKNVAIQIWDIENLNLKKPDRVDGIRLSYRFGWEIAALLNCNSDLIRVHHAWRDRRVDQIAILLNQGTDVLADHRVLTNYSVCLEISQVAHPSLTVRSAQRLAVFGYDSTSIHLWHYLALQEFILGYHNQLLSFLLDRADELTRRLRSAGQASGVMPQAQLREMLIQLVETKAAIYGTFDKVCWIAEKMREKRHAKFFEESTKARGLDAVLGEIERKLRELTSIATDVHQVLLSMDQTEIMRDVQNLNRAALHSKRSLSLLVFAVMAAPAAILADYVGQLFPELDSPTWKGIIGLGLFLLAMLLYWALRKSSEEERTAGKE